MKRCYKFNSLMSQYIDEELNNIESLELEKHIEECASCKEELEQLIEVVNATKSIEEVDIPEGFKTDLHNRLLLESRSKTKGVIRISRFISFRNKYLSIGTSIAACLLIVFLLRGFITENYFSGVKSDDRLEAQMLNEKQSDSMSDVLGVLEDNGNKTEENVEFGAAAMEKSEDTDFERPETSRKTDSTNRVPLIDKHTYSIIENCNINIDFYLSDDIDGKINEIREFALNNSAELSDYKPSLFVEGQGDENNTSVIYLKVRNDDFERFINIFKSNYKDSDTKISSLETKDCSTILEDMRTQLLEIDKKIEEIERNEKSSNPESLGELKRERQDIWDRVEKIQFDSDYTFITVKFIIKDE